MGNIEASRDYNLRSVFTVARLCWIMEMKQNFNHNDSPPILGEKQIYQLEYNKNVCSATVHANYICTAMPSTDRIYILFLRPMWVQQVSLILTEIKKQTLSIKIHS